MADLVEANDSEIDALRLALAEMRDNVGRFKELVEKMDISGNHRKRRILDLLYKTHFGRSQPEVLRALTANALWQGAETGARVPAREAEIHAAESEPDLRSSSERRNQILRAFRGRVETAEGR